MKTKIISLVALISLISISGCSKKNYKPGDTLTITSIEMADEYGESTLIQHNGFDILVDSGSELDANHVKEVLNAKVSDKTIDLLVVTHPHGDHIGGRGRVVARPAQPGRSYIACFDFLYLDHARCQVG